MKTQKLLIRHADGVTPTLLPNEVFVPFNPQIESNNNQSTIDFAGGSILAKRDCVIDLRVSAEAVNVKDFRIFAMKGQVVLVAGKAFSPTLVAADQRLQASFSRRIALAKGETIELRVYQIGVEEASLWLYPETNFVEIQIIN